MLTCQIDQPVRASSTSEYLNHSSISLSAWPVTFRRPVGFACISTAVAKSQSLYMLISEIHCLLFSEMTLPSHQMND